MKTKPDAPIPIRIPADLLSQITDVSEITDISKQDIMRLAMRIGLADMAAIKHDAAALIQQAAEDKGVSFSTWAAQQQKEQDLEHQPRTGSTDYATAARRHLEEETTKPGLNEKQATRAQIAAMKQAEKERASDRAAPASKPD